MQNKEGLALRKPFTFFEKVLAFVSWVCNNVIASKAELQKADVGLTG
jgi:hypothetical protein